MFEHFTEDARSAVTLACDEARGLGHTHCGTGHILLGLLQVGLPPSLAVAGVETDDVRRRLDASTGRGPAPTGGHIPFTPNAKRALELAVRGAIQSGDRYVDTEHLLLGLVHGRRGVAVDVLTATGCMDRVRRSVDETLADRGALRDEERRRTARVQELAGHVAALVRCAAPEALWGDVADALRHQLVEVDR